MRAASRICQIAKVLAKPSISKQFSQTRQLFNTMKLLTVQPELTAALKTEIEAEMKLEAENLRGASPPTIPGFTLSTNDAEVRLTKMHGSEKIDVIFNVNHSVEMGDESSESADPVALPPFTIEITKGDQRFCFHMELVETENGSFDFSVEEYYVAPAAKANNEDVPESVYASSGRYIDPKLHDLLFIRYLEERGFDQQFCLDLVQFATHYEHNRYVDLLKRIDNFVSKP
ncbi:Mitochondrial glycoprotein family-containing protein [Strongyloides ratti]|uniref:Mitochondrial glycoprotein family-containing protein n=1 Tax=Strongyloides ratti TaxID=34506 RepID=A0A090MZ05_STRRB|nr:Mitochondrial glycoprotein family-containing protein [Strongyloides ratti]CEF68094.1 Mitochondrial glycoprotein family-containing protein [Strongyloides ratti]